MYVITIGRSRNNQVVIDDPSGRVSRNHAEIRIKPDGSMVIVDKSVNGTWVNGQPIPKNREFYVYHGDQISFAGKAILDWNKVNYATPGVKGAGGKISALATNLRTNIARDFRNLLDSVIQVREHVQYFKLFFEFLSKGAADRMVAMALRIEPNMASPSTFFSLGLGFFIFFLLTWLKEMLPLSNGQGQSFANFLDAKHMDFMAGTFLLVYLPFATFIWAFLNYKAFKVFSSANRRWRQYFRLHFTYAGIFFLGTGLILVPAILIMLFFTERTFSEEQFCIGLTVTLWFVLTVLLFFLFFRINARFWEENYISVFGIVVFSNLPYFILNLGIFYAFYSISVSP